MGSLRRTLARLRLLATLAVTVVLAGILTSSGAVGSAAGSRADSTTRRVWPVALTGLPEVAPVFCETRHCGVGSTATSARYPGMLYPYPTIAANGDLYLVDYGYGSSPLRVIGLDGRVKRVRSVPGGVSTIALAKDGRIATRGDDDVIREISRSGKIRPIAGDLVTDKSGSLEDCVCGDGGPARKANLAGVSSLAYDPQGRLVIADSAHYRIRRINRNGKIVTIAGTGHPCGSVGVSDPCSPSGTRAASADIAVPRRVAFAPDGTLWFTIVRSGENAVLAHVEKDGRLTYADHGPIEGLTITPDGSLYTLLRITVPAEAVLGKRARILRISPDNKTATPVIGGVNAHGCRKTEISLSCGDGQPPLEARLDSNANSFLASDSHGGLYFGSGGQEIRYLPPPGGKAIRLGLALRARYYEEIRRGHRLSISYRVSSPDARITMRITGRHDPRAIIHDLPGSATGHPAGTLSWNGRIDGKPAPVGSYLIEAIARSRGRIATRQLALAIGP